uniref:solute carrier organic anion transporter family member 2B1 n=1 Tax=Euleptes europaea TaxID=460621 RepID=UPI00253FE843|nr:solute carrier organic anion transporter family member 2B1 [Euleptes europaea]
MSDLKKEVSCVNPFRSVKFFVACQALLQLTQLMASGYMKGSVSTIERRFGFSSQTSGLVASFNEVGNTLLIVFVSYFGSRVHRPRVIGCGAILISVATFIISLPQFLLGMYEYDRSFSDNSNLTDICLPGQPSIPVPEQCTLKRAAESQVALFLLLLGQALLGIATVPIQPFGLSYVDDFASKSNSPFYLGIIFAATTLGPAIAFVLMFLTLRIYVDVDKVPAMGIQLSSSDPRWVGAWWLGFVFTSGLAAASAIPYFFFPRELPKEEDPREVIAEPSKSSLLSEPKGGLEELTLLEFVKMLPVVLMRNFKNPFFVVMIVALINLTSMIAGLATFLGKFLERQFRVGTAYASILIGSCNLPVAMLGLLLGGLIMKKFHLSHKQISLLCVISMGLCLVFQFPLFFLGCPAQQVSGLIPARSSGVGGGLVSDCNRMCNCSSTAYNPICGEDSVEYISPCHAGCSTLNYYPSSKIVVNYTRCSCIGTGGAMGSAVPGSCIKDCSRFLTPFMVLSCIAGFMASITQTPSFMLILRNVKAEDKSFAIGIQFLLLRLTAWLPAPVLYGTIIDTTCILWQWKCQRKAACLYYDSTSFRKRFIGVQLWFEACCFICLVIMFFLYWKKERSQKGPKEENHLDEIPEAEVKT